MAISQEAAWLERMAALGRFGGYVYEPAPDRYVRCTPELARLHGLTPDAFLEQVRGREDLIARVHAADRERYRAALRDLLEHGGGYALEYRLGGDRREPVHLREWAERGADGRIVGCVQDASFSAAELRAARAGERAVKATNERLLAAAEAALSGVVILDAEDRFTYFNRRYLELMPATVQPLLRLGVRFEDVVEAAVAQGPLYHPEMGTDFLARRLERHRAARSDHELRFADGRWVHFRESALPDGGRVVLTSEITDRKRAEAADQLLRAVIDAVPAVIHVKDHALRYQLANRYYLDQWGLRTEQLIGRTQDEVFADDLAFAWSRATDDRDARVVATGEPTGFYEVRVPVRERGEMVLWANKTPLKNERGEVTHILTVGTDITELKRAQETLASQREALHQSEKLKALGSMLASVAHELNNPLSVVIGYATMMEEVAHDDATRQRALRVRAAAERCGRIVRTFLAMARQKPDAHGPVRLNEVVLAALEVAGYGLRSAGIEVALELDEDPPVVAGDADQLALVVMNLLVNAQQALQAGQAPRRIEIRTRARGAAAAIEVADTGPGIPAGAEDQIFEPFFTTKPEGAGTGIGLSVCRSIVRAHGGEIIARSRPGGGACFAVRLPPADAALPAAAATAPDAAPATVRARILVVDDEPELRQLLVEILERGGYTASSAATGREALAQVELQRFDLVVSDLRMPDLDGPGLYRALAERQPELLDRLIFITGATLAPDIAAFLGETGADVIEKPFDPQDLVVRVRQRLEGGCQT